LKQKGAVGKDLVPEEWVAGVVFTLTLIVFSRFVLGVIGQITQYLDINCLTIKKKRAD
jgi:hypothetical protein